MCEYVQAEHPGRDPLTPTRPSRFCRHSLLQTRSRHMHMQTVQKKYLHTCTHADGTCVQVGREVPLGGLHRY